MTMGEGKRRSDALEVKGVEGRLPGSRQALDDREAEEEDTPLLLPDVLAAMLTALVVHRLGRSLSLPFSC
jgi:hypothetical protein